MYNIKEHTGHDNDMKLKIMLSKQQQKASLLVNDLKN